MRTLRKAVGRRRADQREQNHAAAACRNVLGDRERQAAAAANQRKRTCPSHAWRGAHVSTSASARLVAMVKGRLPARMNSKIRLTKALSGCAAADPLDAGAKLAFTEKQIAVGIAHAVNFGLGQAAPAHADNIETDQEGQRSLRHAERDDIGAHAAHADDHGSLANAHELAYRDVAAEHDLVADRDVTAKHRVVGEDDVVADLAVVADMGADHQKAIIADFSQPVIVLGAGVHRHVFADVAFGANCQAGRAAAIAERLRRRTKRRERMNDRARADAGVTGDVDMGNQPAVVADRNVGADRAIGADLRALPDDGAALNPRCRIDPGLGSSVSHDYAHTAPLIGLKSSRRGRLRRRSRRSPWLRRDTTTCSCGARCGSCDIRRCRRARRACETCTCRW